MAAWATKAQARSHWPDAVNLEDSVLDVLLDSAQEQLAASRRTIPATIPTTWVLANVYHARDLYQAGLREGDLIGLGDFVVRARPMTSTVRQLMDPPRGFAAGVG